MVDVVNLPVEQILNQISPWQAAGQVQSVQGSIVVSMSAGVGELCEVIGQNGRRCLAEVIGFDDSDVHIMPFGRREELRRGDLVVASGQRMQIPVGHRLLGRVIDAVGNPVDDLGPVSCRQRIPLEFSAPNALKRTAIDRPFVTGQKAIDGMLTMGYGQRVGLFAGSGVGKSTLLGQIAQNASADMNVIALIGERGREVLPFLQQSLGPEGLKKSVVIVATADENSLTRVRAAETAVAISTWFRQQGNHVMLMLDSLTRFAMAQRDIGLILGEPPTSRGYTPSVFQKIASLLEQLGTSATGSVTGIISVLVEGDDLNDPVADAARSILDGHIVLDRSLANAGHFPAIDILKSASRLFLDVADANQQQAATAIRQILARYQDVADLIQVGAYQRGGSPATDRAIDLKPDVDRFLQQPLQQPHPLNQTVAKMEGICQSWLTPGGLADG